MTLPESRSAPRSASGASGSRFLSPPPEVRITNAFAGAFDNVVATARTCYSGSGIVRDEQILGDPLAPPEARAERARRRDTLARDLYQAGHHTTLQHAHFQFALSNVSRQFLWSFLHSHPFYNSEQVSQRYVTVKPGHYAVPPLAGRALQVYEETVALQQQAYEDLCRLLQGPVSSAYYARYPARRHYPKKYEKEVQKKAQEVARYVLPIATFAYLYHTISGLTLLRYYRTCLVPDAPLEQRLVVGRMVEELLEREPAYAAILEQPIPEEETAEHRAMQEHAARDDEGRKSFLEGFDRQLGDRVSLLVDYPAHNEETLAQSVREVLGVARGRLADDEAIALALDPARNGYLGEALNLTTLSKLSRALVHCHYTFRKRLSHTADSQNQRHRMTPASRPILNAHLTSEPDFVTPILVGQDGPSLKRYREAMEASWDGFSRLRALGVSDEFAAYVLPNALAIRFTESAGLLDLHHKHAMRLCYNAQEEIWRASLDEALQIRAVNPRIGRYLLPPCNIRQMAASRPICPEGRRYCGERVWTYRLEDYRRVI
ncbi:MAG TPA: FAD-dependent thymidylate synthase [Candidatus Polarisedimenticolia bacterium]|nr:FAD-dependent thymidylate synthase [Candidatus Polarisedimenticolia bacterium]